VRCGEKSVCRYTPQRAHRTSLRGNGDNTVTIPTYTPRGNYVVCLQLPSKLRYYVQDFPFRVATGTWGAYQTTIRSSKAPGQPSSFGSSREATASTRLNADPPELFGGVIDYLVFWTLCGCWLLLWLAGNKRWCFNVERLCRTPFGVYHALICIRRSARDIGTIRQRICPVCGHC